MIAFLKKNRPVLVILQVSLKNPFSLYRGAIKHDAQ